MRRKICIKPGANNYSDMKLMGKIKTTLQNAYTVFIYNIAAVSTSVFFNNVSGRSGNDKAITTLDFGTNTDMDNSSS